MKNSPRQWLANTYGPTALLHAIGQEGRFHLGQLPYPSMCVPAHEDHEEGRCSPAGLGRALAVSFMKLKRPVPGYRVRLGGDDDLLSYLAAMQHDDIKREFLCYLERLLSIALLYPARLPVLIGRLDALDNHDLTEQATRAFLREPEGQHAGDDFYFGDDDGIFAGLLDSELWTAAPGIGGADDR
jgi:hypothetical protein